MKPTLITISGYAQSGKDTIADIIIEEAIRDNWLTRKHKFATPLRMALTRAYRNLEIEIDFFTEEKALKEKLRPTMVAFGELAREENPDVFAKIIANEVDEYLSQSEADHPRLSIISDNRYLNEWETMNSLALSKGYTHYHITAVKSCSSGESYANTAERKSIPILQDTIKGRTGCFVASANEGDVETLRIFARGFYAHKLRG